MSFRDTEKKNNNHINSPPQQINYKLRLQKKLQLARESVEPILDLSDCNLKILPSNIFTLCKVFRKDALYLQNNLLTNLNNGGSLSELQNIKILDISANKFSKLPPEINVLQKLEVLDVSKNNLQELPESIGELVKLRQLNLSNNSLHKLPDSMGSCASLEVLNIKFNESLNKLPNCLGKLNSLVQLEFDSAITYPPKDVSSKGLKAIKEFLLKDNKEEPVTPSTSTKNRQSVYLSPFDNLQEQIQLHEKVKMEKQKQLLDIDKQMKENNRKEMQQQQQLKDQKQKLVENVKNQQTKLLVELEKLQEKKDRDRAMLLKAYQEEELKSNKVVNMILESNKKLRDHISDICMRDNNQKEDLLLGKVAQAKALEKKQIIASMNEMMKDEIEKVLIVSAGRKILAEQSLASEILQQKDVLNKLLAKHGENRSQMIEDLKKSEDFQKSAVASLLEKSDAASWELARQVAIVEQQLAELTKLELSKKKIETDCQINELNKSRIALTKLLTELFDQQAERRGQFVCIMSRMEILKRSMNEPESFWMEQYDKLLNSQSLQMVLFLESVDPNLAYEMYLNGVFHYLPLMKDVGLSEEKLRKLNVNTLNKVGVKNVEDRLTIMNAVHNYLKSLDKKLPSAPAAEEPSAPPANEVFDSQFIAHLAPEECVVCLEAKPNIIFVPCGHFCCCYKCFTAIALCPLCRKPIDEIHEVVLKQ